MIWLTWRQFRAPALVTGALLLTMIAALALTWTQVTDAARDTGFTGCQGDACAAAAETFLQSLLQGLPRHVYLAGIATLLLLPSLLGIFWGAPLVARELETGTYRMVFSQSVRRGRWLLIKLASGAAAAALGAGLVSLMLTRWAAPIDAANGERMLPWVFAGRGIVPVGYALLAFVVGLTAGLFLRRTLTAMVVTLLVVAALQIAAPLVVRPWLAQPVTSTTPLDLDQKFGISMSGGGKEMHLEIPPADGDGWVLSNSVVTPAGTEFNGPPDTTQCGPEAENERKTCRAWLQAQNLSQKTVSIPESQFWALQWREFGALIGLALVLSGLALWRIRRSPA